MKASIPAALGLISGTHAMAKFVMQGEPLYLIIAVCFLFYTAFEGSHSTK